MKLIHKINRILIQDIWEGVQYKVNIYAIVYETPEMIIESKELHEKVILINGNLCVYTEDMDRASVMSGGNLQQSQHHDPRSERSQISEKWL